MNVLITEIVRRSEQGVTMPFLCRSKAGDTYFVKGLGVGAEGLRAEWICGHLAKAFKLPVAQFSIVEVPPPLVANSAVEGVAELLGTFGFGSRVVSGAREITFTQVNDLSLEQRAEVLLFDFWIRHADRNLSALGGNPNLLVSRGDEEQPQLWLIDHHNGFDQTFDDAQFWKGHVFAEARGIWSPAWQKRAASRLLRASKALVKAWDTMPANWFPDGDSTSPASVLEYDRLAGILARPTLAPVHFWKLP